MPVVPTLTGTRAMLSLLAVCAVIAAAIVIDRITDK
jgi:hypothetical protein